MEVSTLSVYFGPFDMIVFTILIGLNFLLWRLRINNNLGCLVVFFVFGFILPYYSIDFEIDAAKERWKDEMIDGFNLLYVYIRFPMYWITGVIQTSLINLRIRIITSKEKEELEKERI